MSIDTENAVSEQTLEALVFELAVKVEELIDTTEKQNEMLSLIAEQVKPVLDSMQNSPIGALLGMGK